MIVPPNEFLRGTEGFVIFQVPQAAGFDATGGHGQVR
jgi:hypothetical protein